MSAVADFNLHPRRVARPLQAIQHWRLPDADDESALLQGVLHTLEAMETLTQLEVPVAMCASSSEAERHGDGATLHALLSEAEDTLKGMPHCARISRLSERAPSEAAQLERVRREAVEKLRSLRERVDFVRDGPPLARVSDLLLEEGPAQGEEQGFEVRF